MVSSLRDGRHLRRPSSPSPTTSGAEVLGGELVTQPSATAGHCWPCADTCSVDSWAARSTSTTTVRAAGTSSPPTSTSASPPTTSSGPTASAGSGLASTVGYDPLPHRCRPPTGSARSFAVVDRSAIGCTDPALRPPRRPALLARRPRRASARGLRARPAAIGRASASTTRPPAPASPRSRPSSCRSATCSRAKHRPRKSPVDVLARRLADLRFVLPGKCDASSVPMTRSAPAMPLTASATPWPTAVDSDFRGADLVRPLPPKPPSKPAEARPQLADPPERAHAAPVPRHRRSSARGDVARRRRRRPGARGDRGVDADSRRAGWSFAGASEEGDRSARA